MVRVVKHGDIPTTELKCANCGCEIEASINECFAHKHDFNIKGDITLCLGGIYHCACPECGGIAVSYSSQHIEELSVIEDAPSYHVTITYDCVERKFIAWPLPYWVIDTTEGYMPPLHPGTTYEKRRRMARSGSTPLEAYTDLVSRFAQYEIEEIE